MDPVVKRCDVLVVGGGFAGMYAAISAFESGADVIMLSKGRVGWSGNSSISMSVHRFAPRAPGLREDHRANLLRSCAGVSDPDTVDLFVDTAAGSMEHLRIYGFPLEYREKEEDGRGYPYLACCSPKKGIILTRAIRAHIDEKTSIRLVEGVMVTDIVTEHGEARGVLALRDGKIERYAASSVVLATGGAGQIYADTNNTSDITGDGYAMAIRCGLALRDMEFVQFYPYRIVSPGVADIFPDIFDHGAALRNGKGERFMDRPGYPRKEQEDRDIVAREMHWQDSVWLDLADCDMEHLTRECPNIAKMQMDHPDERLLLRPMAHFFMGGIPLRPDCSTDIGGLYVCGEVAGGLHGANRLAGSALTECVVFGRQAGIGAAAWAARHHSESDGAHAAERIASEYPVIGNDGLKDLREGLRNTMSCDLSMIRSESGMKRAERDISTISAGFAERRPADLEAWFELRNMLCVAQQVIAAAMARKESVGAHYLTDGSGKGSGYG